MTGISDILGFNFVVIGPTLTLLATALILLFVTITISTPTFVKKYVTLFGILSTVFAVFLKFGLFLSDGVSSYFSEKILLDEFALVGNVLVVLVLLFTFNSFWNTSSQIDNKTTEALILILMSASGFLLMVDSENFIMLFIGLEIGSISLHSTSNFGKRCFRRSPTFHASTPKTSNLCDLFENFERLFTPPRMAPIWLKPGENIFQTIPDIPFFRLPKLLLG